MQFKTTAPLNSSNSLSAFIGALTALLSAENEFPGYLIGKYDEWGVE